MMMLLLGKLGTDRALLASLPFASMDADVRQTAGRKVQIPPVGLACSDYRGEVVHTRPIICSDCFYSLSSALPARSALRNVHLIERLGGN